MNKIEQAGISDDSHPDPFEALIRVDPESKGQYPDEQLAKIIEQSQVEIRNLDQKIADIMNDNIEHNYFSVSSVADLIEYEAVYSRLSNEHRLGELLVRRCVIQVSLDLLVGGSGLGLCDLTITHDEGIELEIKPGEGLAEDRIQEQESQLAFELDEVQRYLESVSRKIRVLLLDEIRNFNFFFSFKDKQSYTHYYDWSLHKLLVQKQLLETYRELLRGSSASDQGVDNMPGQGMYSASH